MDQTRSKCKHVKLDFNDITQLALEIIRNIFENRNDVVYIDVECAKLIRLAQFIPHTDTDNKNQFHLFLCYLISWFMVVKYRLLTKERFTDIYHQFMKPESKLTEYFLRNVLLNDTFDYNRLQFKYYRTNDDPIYQRLEPHLHYRDLIRNVQSFAECDWYSFCYDVTFLMHRRINQYSAYKFCFFAHILREILLTSDVDVHHRVIYELERVMLNVIIHIDTKLHMIPLTDSVKKFCLRYANSCHPIYPSNITHFVDILLQ
eukprot:91641_1